MGVALDRFDRRRVLLVVNGVLGVAVAAVPVWAAVAGTRADLAAVRRRRAVRPAEDGELRRRPVADPRPGRRRRARHRQRHGVRDVRHRRRHRAGRGRGADRPRRRGTRPRRRRRDLSGCSSSAWARSPGGPRPSSDVAAASRTGPPPAGVRVHVANPAGSRHDAHVHGDQRRRDHARRPAPRVRPQRARRRAANVRAAGERVRGRNPGRNRRRRRRPVAVAARPFDRGRRRRCRGSCSRCWRSGRPRPGPRSCSARRGCWRRRSRSGRRRSACA